MAIAHRPALAALVACVALLLVAPAGPARAQDTAVHCDLTVAAGGSDSGDGSAAAPIASLHRLADALGAGQTACVRGQVRGDLWISAPGAKLTSEPGQRGVILGQVVVDKDADHVTVSDLNLDSTGVPRPSPIILGDDVTFARNDVTNGHGPTICFILGQFGHDDNALAERATIEANRIHDCGTSDNHRHGIYVEHADGTHIIGNEIFDNADRGIQLYPSAQNTLIEGNVIDGNGEGVIFSGGDGNASSGNVVRNNVISNPRLRSAIESYYPEGTPPGQANAAYDNCVFGAKNLVDLSGGGFTARDNVEADPTFVDRGAKDFRLQPGSPCAELLAAGRDGMAAPSELTAAPTQRIAAAAAPATTPLAVSVKRTGGRVRVSVRLTRTLDAPSFVRVQVRYGSTWKTLGVKRVVPKRTVTVTGRAPKGGHAVKVRASLLRGGKSTRVTFRRR